MLRLPLSIDGVAVTAERADQVRQLRFTLLAGDLHSNAG